MEIDLEKIDTIRERTGVSYKQAKEALQNNNGDVVEALIYLEEKSKASGSDWTQSISNKGDELLEKLKQILKEGNVTRIVVRKNGEIKMNIPINAGAIGFLWAPFLATIGVTTAVLAGCTIEITKKDGEVINLEEVYGKAVSKVKQSFTESEKNDLDKTE